MQTLVIDTSYGSTVGVVGHEPIVETDSRTHVEKLQVNIAHAVEHDDMLLHIRVNLSVHFRTRADISGIMR